MAISSFFHPAIGFLCLALVLPFLPSSKAEKGQGDGQSNGFNSNQANFWRWLLLVPPLIAIASVFMMTDGNHLTLTWVDQSLEMGRVDSLSRIFAQVFAIMSLAGMLYAMHVGDRLQHIMASLYVAGAFGCVFAGDYLTLFLFWELMCVGSTFLVLCNRTQESVLAGFRYFLYHIAGGLLLLAGLVLRYKALDTMAFTAVAPHLDEVYNWLILAGFCVNAAVVPLHAWLPDAYPRGTVTGSVFMCAFTTKTAVYVLSRGFAGWEILAVMGTVMAVYGVLYACIENNARRILSYHIVSQVGYMVAGIGLGTAMTLNGVAAHAYAHILYKGLLFMGAGCLLYSTGTASLEKLGGLAARLPWVMILYMVGALSISGMPLFNGFISKTMIIAGAAESHNTLIALGLEIAAVGTFISVGIKLPYFAFWGNKPTDTSRELRPIPANMYAGMALLAVLCLAQGICPEILYAYLPQQMAEPFVPWTVWNVVQSLMLLSFSGLAFYAMRKVITPHAGLNLDFDYIYRAIGKLALLLISKPLAFLDSLWTNVYNTVGLRGLMATAKGSSLFDQHVIDGLVDGLAVGVKNLGKLGAAVQNGDLQRYIGITVLVSLLIYAIFWYLN